MSLLWNEPTLLAPLEGVGHAAFRDAIAACGAPGVLCTEFISVGRGSARPGDIRRTVVKSAGLPLSAQLLGLDPERMAAAAQEIRRAGADIVDVNLGCPARRVVSRGAGAALLDDPEGLSRLLDALRAATAGPFSAKMRAPEDPHRLVDLARLIAASGVDFLTVHPRRRTDRFRGVADWRRIRAVKAHLRIPVVGNGDCWYAADALRMMEETGCDAVMLGRPAIRNPWIFAQISALLQDREPIRPGGADVVAYLRQLVTRYDQHFESNERLVTGKLKEIIRYLGRAVDDGGEFRRRALRSATTTDILTVAEEHLAELPAERFDLDAHGSLGFERSGSAQ